MERAVVGLVGYGTMGSAHARNAVKNPKIEFAAVSDIDPRACARARKVLGVRTYREYKEMFEKESLHGVVLAAPPNLLPKMTEDAALDNINVFCEKPFGVDHQSAKKAIERVVRSKIKFGFGLVLRYTESYKKAKQMIEEREIGEPKICDGRYTGFGMPDYVYEKKTCRGLVYCHTIHMLDIVCFLIGVVESVNARFDVQSSDEVERNAVVTLDHESGCHTCVVASGDSTLGSHCLITGETGELAVEKNTTLKHYLHGTGRELERTIVDKANLGYYEELDDFARAILEEKQTPQVSVKQALESAQLLEAVYRSAYTKKPIKL